MPCLFLAFGLLALLLWLAGSFTDLDLNDVIDQATGESVDKDDNSRTNWKLGGYYRFGLLTFGLQYEDAEIGTLDNNPEGGKYIFGSLDFTKNSVTIAAWVAGYLSDIEDSERMLDDEGKPIDEDAFSWAIGAKYHFSKRTQIYAGYRETDSNNDFRDENVGTLGIRHVF
jgi:predicted porin